MLAFLFTMLLKKRALHFCFYFFFAQATLGYKNLKGEEGSNKNNKSPKMTCTNSTEELASDLIK